MGSNTRTQARLRVEVVEKVTGLPEVWRLRAARFRPVGGTDRDVWDRRSRHVLIRDPANGRLAGYFRMMLIRSEPQLNRSYAASRYDLTHLADYRDPMIEVGRFCIDPDYDATADVQRVAWAALTREVDAQGVGLLFGCASFPGTDPAAHRAALAHLADHAAPAQFQIGQGGAAERIALSVAAHGVQASPAGVPPLLRSYLAMGGWVSDHLVVDRDLGTLHVFAGLEVRAVPVARALALRRLVG